MLMVIPTDIASLIDFFSFAAWLFYGMAVFCVILLRFTKKKAERKIKVYEKHKAKYKNKCVLGNRCGNFRYIFLNYFFLEKYNFIHFERHFAYQNA